MNRLEHEDRIIELLRRDLPGVHVDSLPLGLSDRLALQVRTATVWVVYGGGQIKSPADHNVGQHIEYWHWTILILAAAYRSMREGRTFNVRVSSPPAAEPRNYAKLRNLRRCRAL